MEAQALIGFTWTAIRLIGRERDWRQASLPAATAIVSPARTEPRFHATLQFSLIFVAATVCLCSLSANLPLAVYALSFWHYYLYWLAYYFGAVPLGDFKRDALLMKTIALIAMALVYLACPLDLISLSVMACGFSLNAWAARVLGADRTYYGHEVANLPHKRLSGFPYSWISHPMIVGNVVAFGGTLINADFRREWWPLAVIHILLNLGLLAMELVIKPQRRSVCPAPIPEERHDSLATDVLMVAAAAAFSAATFSRAAGTLALLTVGIFASAYAACMYRAYAFPKSALKVGPATAEENFS